MCFSCMDYDKNESVYYNFLEYEDIPAAVKAWITIKAKRRGLNPVMVHAGIKAHYTKLKQKETKEFNKIKNKRKKRN